MLTITLAPAFTLRPPSTVTIAGLTGSDMVPGVAKVVDCIPSPCLSVGGERWDRAHGRLVVTVLAGQEVGAGTRLVMTLLTRNPRHTQPPVTVYVEARTEFLGLAVKSLSPTPTCPHNPPPLADPGSPAAAAVTDASSCTPPGAEAVAGAPGISAPLFVRIWEMVRLVLACQELARSRVRAVLYVSMYVCMYVCVNVCMYVCMYV